ncbi:MAG: Ig-like domain-containing protein [Oscillospiraceae bacterium]|nr:Ig-like domain-containing protein [Oscillospiraceae bacterium]
MKKRIKKSLAFLLALCCMVSLAAFDLAPAADAAAPKKAIYILPGFAESRLYDTYGGEIWAGLGIVPDIARDLIGLKSQMANNPDGTGMLAYADRSRDTSGTIFCFEPMILSLKAGLKARNMDGEYDVVLFSYNWLQDLQVTAKELEDDIKAKGYEKVILITHSNGGLLATTFISLSAENKAMVERAFLIAAPLLGTFTALEPPETGTMTMFDGTLFMGLVQLGYDVFVKPLTRHYVRSWTVNSPNIYQLMAGPEYISKIPLVYKTSATTTQYINTAAEYYSLLKQSDNINDLLVDGNTTKSMKYLRETVFNGDPIGQWDGVDVMLLGSQSGFITPVSAVYKKVGSKAVYQGAVYSKEGDGLVAGISMNGDGRLRYINFEKSAHLLIIMDPRVLVTLNKLIANEYQYLPPNPVVDPVGMSDTIKLHVTSATSSIKTAIYDASGNLVARSDGEAREGFTSDKFYFLPVPSNNDTDIEVLMPKEGYKAVFTTIPLLDLDCKVDLTVTSMDASGASRTRTDYRVTGANLTGQVFTIDNVNGSNPSNTPNAVKKLSVVSTQTFYTDWGFESGALAVAKGGKVTVALTGADVSSGNVTAGKLQWSSSDTSVATVSSAGVVTAKKAGAVDITAVISDESLKIETCRVTVTQPVTGVDLTPSTLKVAAGVSSALTATVKPADATDKSVIWTSSNPGVAEVSADGVVTGIKAGTATITATTVDGAKKDTCSVTVTQPVLGVSLDAATITLAKGKTQKLIAAVSPADATDKSLTWSSNNKTVATVSSTGTVTALKAGTATVTVTTKDGAFTAECIITVT